MRHLPAARPPPHPAPTAHGYGRPDRPASVTANTTMHIGSCDDRGAHSPQTTAAHDPGERKKEVMSVTPNDYVDAPDLVAATREFIRREGHACVVSIYRLLDELSEMFGNRFVVSPDVYKVLDLIETLWADPSAIRRESCHLILGTCADDCRHISTQVRQYSGESDTHMQRWLRCLPQWHRPTPPT